MRRKITSIAISGSACSGKTTLATMLAANLEWKHVNVGQIFRDLAQSSGISIDNFGLINDSALRRVDQVERRMSRTPHHVWEGRLTAWLARTIPNVVSVYCFADRRTREERCSRRESLSTSKATALIAKRDEEEKRVFFRLYGIANLQGETHFDLSLDTSGRTPRELLHAVRETLDRDFILT